MKRLARDSNFGSASAARLEALLDAVVDAVVTIDERGTILGINAAATRLFGYAADELIGFPVSRLMPEPYRSEHDGYVARYLEGGEAHIIGIGREVKARTRAGETFPIWLSVGEAVTDEGREFVAVIRDLSAEKQAESERRSLEARLSDVARFSLMGEMTAGIAHEINQPLAAIMSYAQAAKRLLERGDTGSESLAKACDGISTQAARASEIIENLRGFLRKQPISTEPLSVNEVVEDVLTLVRTDAREARIGLEVELGAGLPPVLGDPMQLQQVLLNLTRNAVDAMADSPVEVKARGILISTAPGSDGGVELSVCDHGPGVSNDVTDSIFHPFVTTKPDGLGVGLAISHRIMQAHFGALSYANAAGGGAVFIASLPAYEAPSGA